MLSTDVDRHDTRIDYDLLIRKGAVMTREQANTQGATTNNVQTRKEQQQMCNTREREKEPHELH